jgi:hypothetical protein
VEPQDRAGQARHSRYVLSSWPTRRRLMITHGFAALCVHHRLWLSRRRRDLHEHAR